MKRKYQVLGALACASALGVIATSVQLPVGQVQAASITNDDILAAKPAFSGVRTWPTTFTEGGKYRTGKPEGVVIHSTDDMGRSAVSEATRFINNWQSSQSYVHAFVDATGVIQIHPTNETTWGAGSAANKRFIQIELCETTNSANFKQSVYNDAVYVASLLKEYGLQADLADRDGEGTIWSHNAVSEFLGGTSHTDPIGYFDRYGYSMEDFVSLVQTVMDQGVAANSVSEPVASKAVNFTATIRLASDTPVYTNAGGGETSKVLKAGSAWQAFKYQDVKGMRWYNLGGNQWVPFSATNGAKTVKQVVKPTPKPAPAPSYTVTKQNKVAKVQYIPGYGIAVWSSPAGKTTGKYLKHGTSWKTFGVTTVNGEDWLNLGGNQWIPAKYTNLAAKNAPASAAQKPSKPVTPAATTTVKKGILTINYKKNYSIVVWSMPGAKPTKQYLKTGTRWKFFQTTEFNGETWYKLGTNQWVPAKYIKVN